MDYSSEVDLVFYYLIFINLIGFIAFTVDKYRARKNKWRIPEKSLMTLAIIGGSLGSLFGMYFIRHKTHNKKFTVGIPIIVILQILLLYTIFY